MQSNLSQICQEALETLNLSHEADRLRYELRQIEIQEEDTYVLDLYKRKVRYPRNEYNSFVYYLLGLVPSYDSTIEADFVLGEWPDVDLDFPKPIRKYVRDDYIPRTFGRDKVCAISTYGTMGIKSSILDVTKTYGGPKEVIQAITVTMEDKDDEGKVIEWDKALELYPEFKAYCDEYPVIAEKAKAMQGRYKSAGIHAGGLIIADRSLEKLIPLEVRSPSKENPKGIMVAAWTEGLNSQDLGPVGLVKFDILGITNLDQIALACELIRQRHPDKQDLWALPGQPTWSDTSYLNDPKAIAMANKADLKCIFQFDGSGIRKLVKKGGVDSFDDMVAYASLFRPGCLRMGMDDTYCKRKKGKEKYELHHSIRPILNKTYGVMVYQEQIMKILHIVGDIPLIHCEKVRKAISKKKVEQFLKYKDQFIERGQINLNATKDYVEQLWQMVVAFSDYGFNLSHATAYTYISMRLLNLKAHFPLEFYSAVLSYEKDSAKIKDYKLDASYHDVEIRPLHINHSKENFAIHDEAIYYGFVNLKSVGESVTERIVANQPYTSFQNFLEKFGTDGAVLKALVSLGVFDEPYDRETLWNYYEFYKKEVKDRAGRTDRYEASMQRLPGDLRALVKTGIGEDHPDFEKMCQFTIEAQELWSVHFGNMERLEPYNYKGENRTRKVTLEKLIVKLAEKREKLVRMYEARVLEDGPIPGIDNFDANKIKVDAELLEVLRNEVEFKGRKYYPIAERIYYGFQWVADIERSPDYTGLTMDRFLDEVEHGLFAGPIEVEILGVRAKISKKNTKFWAVDLVDANGKMMTANVWEEDYKRWSEELVKGNFVRMRVRPPSGGFNTLTFQSPARHERHKLPKTKEEDYRLIVMRSPYGN